MIIPAVVEVLATGPLTTVQDEGRPGHGHLGIGRSGACDRTAYRLANRLVGNHDGAAALEVTYGGLRLLAHDDVLVVSTGARCPGAVAHNAPRVLRRGDVLSLGAPSAGLRSYVAVRGGFDVDPVLGSRATDTLSGLGPAPLAAGDRLTVARATRPFPGVDLAPVAEPEAGAVTVGVTPGPRRDWFPEDAWSTLLDGAWEVSSASDRVGIRLEGSRLPRTSGVELPSEGMVRGALQVPPSGLPVLFLADHPVTGGYPVIAYAVDDDVDRCGQLRPGQALRLRAVRPPL